MNREFPLSIISLSFLVSIFFHLSSFKRLFLLHRHCQALVIAFISSFLSTQTESTIFMMNFKPSCVFPLFSLIFLFFLFSPFFLFSTAANEISLINEVSKGRWFQGALVHGIDYPPRDGRRFGSIVELAVFRGLPPSETPGVLLPLTMLHSIYGEQFSTADMIKHFQCCLRVDVRKNTLRGLGPIFRFPVIGIYDNRQEGGPSLPVMKMNRAAGDRAFLVDKNRNDWMSYVNYQIVRYPLREKDGYTFWPWFWPRVERNQWTN